MGTASIAWLVGAHVLAYLVGAIPIGLLLAKAKGIDLREVGSGNIGATNAARGLGRAWGQVVFLLDGGKAALPVVAARLLLAPHVDPGLLETWAGTVGAAAFVGHVFPIYLGFRGGKGVACAFGIFCVFTPLLGVSALVIYLQTLWLSRKTSIASLTAVSAMVLLVWAADTAPSLRGLVFAFAVLIWIRHADNIRALRGGDAAEATRTRTDA